MIALLTYEQRQHLRMLQALVLANVQNYDHTDFKNRDTGKMCAIGLAVEHRAEYFPDLKLKWSENNPSGIDNMGGGIVEDYFGEKSWSRIFGFRLSKNGSGGYPDGLEVAEDIKRYLEEDEQCAARLHVECTTLTEPGKNS